MLELCEREKELSLIRLAIKNVRKDWKNKEILTLPPSDDEGFPRDIKDIKFQFKTFGNTIQVLDIADWLSECMHFGSGSDLPLIEDSKPPCRLYSERPHLLCLIHPTMLQQLITYCMIIRGESSSLLNSLAGLLWVLCATPSKMQHLLSFIFQIHNIEERSHLTYFEIERIISNVLELGGSYKRELKVKELCAQVKDFVSARSTAKSENVAEGIDCDGFVQYFGITNSSHFWPLKVLHQKLRQYALGETARQASSDKARPLFLDVTDTSKLPTVRIIHQQVQTELSSYLLGISNRTNRPEGALCDRTMSTSATSLPTSTTAPSYIPVPVPVHRNSSLLASQITNRYASSIVMPVPKQCREEGQSGQCCGSSEDSKSDRIERSTPSGQRTGRCKALYLMKSMRLAASSRSGSGSNKSTSAKKRGGKFSSERGKSGNAWGTGATAVLRGLRNRIQAGAQRFVRVLEMCSARGQPSTTLADIQRPAPSSEY